MTVTPHLVEALLQHAAVQPDKDAVAWLADGDRESERLTYGVLVARVKSCAAALQEQGLEGKPVMIGLAPGIDYLLAILAAMFAGAIAVPMPPQRSAASGARWRSVLEKVRPAALIEKPIGPSATQWHPPCISEETTAFLQFTSGSTGAPKGAIISHRALTENRAMIREAFAHDPDWRCVTWLPPWHDMGLVGGLLQPLGEGMFVAMLSTLAVVQRPVRWLRAIDHYQATVSGGPLFGYQACVERVDEETQSLDLRSWKLAYCGAETVRAHALEDFAGKFRSSGFDSSALYSCYGLAEATLFVTGPERGSGLKTIDFGGRTLVSCGKPRRSGAVRICDPISGSTLRPGIVGEIRVSGKHLATGYWGERGFAEEIRTGDLGLLCEGELYVVGRLKDQLILRGAKHHAEDLEDAALSAHSTIRAAAAFAIETGQRELGVTLVEASRHVAAQDVRNAVLSAVLRQCGVRLDIVEVVTPGTLPRTTSGKIERHRCRATFERRFATNLSEVA